MKTRREFLKESASLSAGLFVPAIHSAEALAANPRNLEALGFVDVTSAPFQADPSGKADSTAELQKAIDSARDRQMAVFFPPGVYRVSGTLNCLQQDKRGPHWADDARNWPVVLTGSRAGHARPRIYLAPNAPGFTDPAKPKYVVYYRRAAILPGGEIRLHPEGALNDQFIGIDLEIGEGNAGAVAIRMRAAQSSSIQDSTIYAQHGLTGVEGGTGSGGGHIRVTVIGGKIGLDMRETQPSPNITGITLIDQTETAILYAGHQALTATGIRIESSAPGPLIRAEDLYTASGQGEEIEQGVWRGPISLIDSEIVFKSQPGVAIQSNSAVYLNNVYVKGASFVVRQPGAGALKGNAHGWMLAREYARGCPMRTYRGFDYSDPVYVDGQRRDAVVNAAMGIEPPEDLQSRHIWNNDFPSWEDAKTVNVKDAPYGAIGDGKADDTAAIQRAIDDHEVVFLPKGFYRVTKTIDLRPNTKLLGIGGVYSILKADEQAFAGIARPILRSANDANAETVLGFLGAWPQSAGAFALHWRSGRRSLIRSWVTNFDFMEVPYPLIHPSVLVNGNGGGRWYNWSNESWSRIFAPPYRHLLAEGTREPFRVYMFNPEHARCDALTEFRDCRDVTLYGTKSEGNYPAIKIKDSDNVRVFGYGGNATPYPTMSLFLVEDTPNFLVTEIFNRVQRAGAGGLNVFSGIGVDPSLWYALAEKLPGGDEVHTAPLERPVLYKRGQPNGGPPD